jgi:glutamyl-tRNA reductase
VLDNLGMIGVSWRQGGTESLAAFTPAKDDLGVRLQAFAAEQALSELALIATCNRVELMFARRPGGGQVDLRPAVFEFLTGRRPEGGEARRRLRAWQGEGAAEHLFLIAAGLDSACVGETEIVGQVKAAHQAAREHGLSGTTLDLVFDEALRIAARVRGETRIGAGRVSLAEIATDAVRERLGRTPGRAALIGVSPMTERTAAGLASSALAFIVVNRSIDKARKLAERYGQTAMSLETFLRDPPAVEAILSATGAEGTVVDWATLERLAVRTPSHEPLLIVDMAVPADVDAKGAAALGMRRLGMDAIVALADANRAQRLNETADAREQVDAALDELQERMAEKLYGPLLGALQKRYQRTAEEGVRRLLKKELNELGADERAAIETWSQVLARRFAHIPCLGLRGLLYAGPAGSIDAFLDGLEPEFADELRQALASSPAARTEPRTESQHDT